MGVAARIKFFFSSGMKSLVAFFGSRAIAFAATPTSSIAPG